MRRYILAVAATLSLLAAGSLAPDRAEAMSLSTPAGIRAAVDSTSLSQDVAYYCRRVWRCGLYGCGWRQSCGWSGPRYYRSYGYYRPYRSYGYRSYGYARPYYRHHYSYGRHWHHY